MAVDIKVEGLERLGGVLSRFITDLGIDSEVIIKQTARQLANDFMTETAPFIRDLNSGQTGIVSNKKVAKDTGINAIRHDLLNCVTPVSEIFDQAFKNKYVEKIIKNKNVAGLQALIAKSNKLRGWKVVPFTKNLHTDQRDRYSRYRVPKSLRQMTFDERELRRYQQSLEKRVGFSKAGWGLTVAALGGKVPPWISRHFGYCKGTVQTNIQDKNNPSVEFSNSSGDIGRYHGRYNYAIQLRADKMLLDLQHKINYHLRRFGFN